MFVYKHITNLSKCVLWIKTRNVSNCEECLVYRVMEIGIGNHNNADNMTNETSNSSIFEVMINKESSSQTFIVRSLVYGIFDSFNVFFYHFHITLKCQFNNLKNDFMKLKFFKWIGTTQQNVFFLENESTTLNQEFANICRMFNYLTFLWRSF